MLWCSLAFAWQVLGPEGVATGRTVETTTLFSAAEPAWVTPHLVSEPAAVAQAATDALAWIDAHPDAPVSGLFPELGVDRQQTRRTLARIAEIAAEDTRTGATRLTDPTFVRDEFALFRWTPDVVDARTRRVDVEDGQIRLTRYFIPQVSGSPKQTKTYSTALYADPGEPYRSRYTRDEVFGGVYEKEAKGVARALVWLRPQDAHDALLQGTVEVRWEDQVHLLNVDVPNAYAYVPGAAKQQRLWYFREVDRVYGYGSWPEKVPLQTAVSVAGDPWNLGIGRVFLLEYPDGAGGTSLRLAVMGDTGGAFQPNLFQLDWFAGAWPDRAALYAGTADLPGRVGAWVLVAR